MLWKLSLSYMCRTFKVCKCDKKLSILFIDTSCTVYLKLKTSIFRITRTLVQITFLSWFSIHLLANCGVCFCLNWYSMWLFSNSNRQHQKEVTGQRCHTSHQAGCRGNSGRGHGIKLYLPACLHAPVWACVCVCYRANYLWQTNLLANCSISPIQYNHAQTHRETDRPTETERDRERASETERQRERESFNLFPISFLPSLTLLPPPPPLHTVIS